MGWGEEGLGVWVGVRRGWEKVGLQACSVGGRIRRNRYEMGPLSAAHTHARAHTHKRMYKIRCVCSCLNSGASM